MYAEPTYREVSKEEFFASVGQMNVHPSIQGRYPYTALWMTPIGSIQGKTVDYIPEGKALPLTRYYARA